MQLTSRIRRLERAQRGDAVCGHCGAPVEPLWSMPLRLASDEEPLPEPCCACGWLAVLVLEFDDLN